MCTTCSNIRQALHSAHNVCSCMYVCLYVCMHVYLHFRMIIKTTVSISQAASFQWCLYFQLLCLLWQQTEILIIIFKKSPKCTKSLPYSTNTVLKPFSSCPPPPYTLFCNSKVISLLHIPRTLFQSYFPPSHPPGPCSKVISLLHIPQDPVPNYFPPVTSQGSCSNVISSFYFLPVTESNNRLLLANSSPLGSQTIFAPLLLTQELSSQTVSPTFPLTITNTKARSSWTKDHRIISAVVWLAHPPLVAVPTAAVGTGSCGFSAS